MRSVIKQKGQAMIFGLLFLAVVIMALLILYNQGQLVTNRIQLENAADASVYSQAKLAARNQNFIAYTNRSMVANEVSIGQMVAILSWAKHYKQMPAFNSFPIYQIPILPTALTIGKILEVVTLPWVTLGNVVTPPAQKMVEHWPTVVSVFNGVMGVFQKIFAVATLEAQIEVGIGVIEDYEDNPDDPEMYIPVIGWFFFTQNALLTYFGDNFHIDDMVNRIDTATAALGFTASAEDLAEEYLGGTMIADNSPGLSSKKAKNGGGAKDANVNTGDEAESNAVEAYQRYAAIVNRNRADFTADRHWNIGLPQSIPIPEIVLPLGIITLTIDLEIDIWFGVKNDGGTAYAANGAIEEDDDIAKLGWSSIDVLSFGVDFTFKLTIGIEVCLFSCFDTSVTIGPIEIPLFLPLGGATHQVVSDNLNARRIMPDWDWPFTIDTDKWGGDPDDSVNDGAFGGSHLAVLGWGQISPQLMPGGMFGVRPEDVTDSYAAPPAFFSLGSHFQEKGRSYEFTTAVAKSLDDVVTTDSATIGIDSDGADSDGEDIDYTRFDVETHSRAEGNDLAADYQQFIWNDDRPMMTISSAETYFKNPMQTQEDGSAEPASLFSPFWDARLREPSAAAILLATGEIDFEEIFNLGDSAVAMVDWLLRAIGDRLVDTGVDYLLEQIDPPMDALLEDPIRDGAGQVMDIAIDEVVDELSDFVP